MKYFIKLNLIVIVTTLFASCATSMSPAQVNSTLPTLTKSKFIAHIQAEEAVKMNKCKYLVKGRNYTAPIGMTVNSELKDGARAIDEWVGLDGGNTYVLTNYKWVAVDQSGATQLHIEFNTMICKW